jgi:predicted nucleotidyltransferase component of viral defense system
MLTRTQIQRLAQRNHIGMQAQERDYLQHLLLALLYTRSQTLIFKGGTALRIVYHGNRYSEDLDFNGPDAVEPARSLWGGIVVALKDFGIHAEMRNEWETEVGYSFDVSFQGPLYDGRDRSKGKVRIDLNRRPEAVETQRELIESEYDDVRPFVATVLTPAHLLAEKFRALLVRCKPRDLYDVWLLTQQGIMPDWSLVERKLALYGLRFSQAVWDEALIRVRADWERDLQPLLSQWVDYVDVIRSLEKLKIYPNVS